MLIALEPMELRGEEGLKLKLKLEKKKKAVPKGKEHTHKEHKSMHVSITYRSGNR